MTVKAKKAISFKCEKCGHRQYADYALELQWEPFGGVAVLRDAIDCTKCAHENIVIQEL